MQMEEMKKEIESLKRKIFYLFGAMTMIFISFTGLAIRQVKQYSDIQNYYFDSIQKSREMNQDLKDILSEIQSTPLQRLIENGKRRIGGGKMLKKIYTELVLIRKELQAIRSSMEFNAKITIDSRHIAESIRQIQARKDRRVEKCE